MAEGWEAARHPGAGVSSMAPNRVSPRIQVLLQLPRILRRFVPLARPGVRLPLATMAAMVFSALVDVGTLGLLAAVFDLLQGKDPEARWIRHFLGLVRRLFPEAASGSLLVPYVELVLVAFAIRALVLWGVILLTTRLANRVSTHLRQSLFSSLLSARPEIFDRTKTGEFSALFSNHLGWVILGFENLLQMGLRGTLILVALSFVVWQSWQVALLLVTITGLLAGPVIFLQAPLKRRGVEQAAAHSGFYGLLGDIFSGMRVVRFSGAQGTILGRFGKTIAGVGQAEVGYRRMAILIPIVLEYAAMTAVLLLVLASYFWLIRPGLLSVGELIGILLIASRLVPNLNLFATAYGLVTAASGYMEQMESWFRQPSFPSRPFGSRCFQGIREELRFEGVNFRYGPERLVLSDVRFSVPAGAKVALVGASGSGKSTVAALLMRLREPESGVVRVDGVDFWEFSAESWHSCLGVVEQEPFLFHDTIRFNLTFGLGELGPERIQDALRIADLESVVAAQPKGLDTPIGERGATLSGGQRQRLAIARAVARDPRLLILDEATSALDTATEREVQKALDAAMAGRTTLIIAHRLSTVRNADRIVVFDQGRVVEQGTWDELTALNGAFARLVHLNALQG